MREVLPAWVTRRRAGALLFLGLSCFYGAQIPNIQQLPVDRFEAMNARSFPRALAVAGVVLSLLLLLTGKPVERDAPLTSEEEAAETPAIAAADVATAGGLLLWTGGFALLLGWLGFWPATAVFLLGGFWLLGERRARFGAGIALLVASVLYLLLRFGLGLYLPPGTLWLALSMAGTGNP